MICPCWLFVFFSIKKSYRFSSPIPMDQFAWTREQAVSRMGIIMSVGGVILILLYLMMNTFTKYVGERKLLIFCGIIPTIIGQSLFSPMTSEKPQMFGNFTIGGRYSLKTLPFKRRKLKRTANIDVIFQM